MASRYVDVNPSVLPQIPQLILITGLHVDSHVPTYTSAILVPPRPFLIHTVAVPDPPVNPRAA